MSRKRRKLSMSDIKFDCPGCECHIEIDASAVGLAVQCPRCSKTILVPSGGSVKRGHLGTWASRVYLWIGSAIVLLALAGVLTAWWLKRERHIIVADLRTSTKPTGEGTSPWSLQAPRLASVP